MLLKVLFLLVLVYVAVRTIANLFKAIWTDPTDRDRIRHPSGRESAGPIQAPPAQGAQRRYDVEVEDARWVDVDRRA